MFNNWFGMGNWWASAKLDVPQRSPAGKQPSSSSSSSSFSAEPCAVGVELRGDAAGAVWAVSVVPPAANAAPKLDMYLVIDISGSMGDSANPNGGEDIRLFTKLDLAIRGAEVVARSLTPDDTLAVLAFNNLCVRCLPRTKMDAQGLAQAVDMLSQLLPGGGTALWDGLCSGLQELEVEAKQGAEGEERLAVVILLTDGQPFPSPPESELAALAKYLAAHAAAAGSGRPLKTAKLVTMGFGYDVNSKLLVDLANAHGLGSNGFCFIPDGSMLLTNFVNMMANLKSTCMRRAVLRILPAAAPPASSATTPPADVAQAMDDAFTTDAGAAAAAAPQSGAAAAAADLALLLGVVGETPWKAVPGVGGAGAGIEVSLGDVLYGCPRQMVLREKARGAAVLAAKLLPACSVQLVFEPVVPGFAGSMAEWSGTQAMAAGGADAPFVMQQLHRAQAVSAIHQAARVACVDLEGAQKLVKERALATMAHQDGPLLQGMQPHPILEDLLGQVSEALSNREAWDRWGCHYLRSLLLAHQAEACNNFKDPGVLAYGSARTRGCRDELNTMCDSLPVPTPSILPRGHAIGQPVSSAAFTAAFNWSGGGCFGPGTAVRMAGGCTRPVESLCKGDAVRVPGGAPARVVCLVTYSGALTVRLPGSRLRITPWHPVRLGGEWAFPVHVAADALLACNEHEGEDGSGLVQTPPAVYNLVLDSGHVVEVDGVETVTLGHGFQEPVVRHDFFGTAAVIDSLRALPGWEQGIVHLGAEHSVVRDPSTGLINGFTSTLGQAATVAA